MTCVRNEFSHSLDPYRPFVLAESSHSVTAPTKAKHPRYYFELGGNKDLTLEQPARNGSPSAAAMYHAFSVILLAK